MKKRVYLAGAMGCYGEDVSKAKGWRDQAKKWFKETTDNFKCISPTDYYVYGKPFHKTEREVMNFDLRNVRNSDVVLVNLEDLDKSTGTSDEILLAHLCDIPVVGFLIPKTKVYNSDEEVKKIHPWKFEQIDRIECGYDSMVKAMQYIKDYYG